MMEEVGVDEDGNEEERKPAMQVPYLNIQPLRRPCVCSYGLPIH